MTVSIKTYLDLSHEALTLEEQAWVEKPALELVTEISSGRITSTEVVTAFLKQAVVANGQTNCLTQFFKEDALRRAKELDEFYQTNKKPVGLLHGLPISVKEHILMKDTVSSCGYIQWSDKISDRDSFIVQKMKEAGAVIICKTTNPQSLLALETVSNLYGRTCNAFNSSLTSGGSSGGEGALLGLNGSTLGIGTDIGGSIRTPASFNGLYGLKPSVGRLPHSGLLGNHDGMENILGCVGPLARSPKDLDLFCRASLSGEPWYIEQGIVPIPWKHETEIAVPEKLCIAIIWDDGIVRPQPPVHRALKVVETALKQAGHEIIYWSSPEAETVYKNTMQTFLLDGGEEYIKCMPKDIDPPVHPIQWLLKTFGGKRLSLEDTWELNKHRATFQTKYNDLWNNTKGKSGRIPDAILCPVHASAAPPHNNGHYWGYTGYWNYLDFPSAVFPVTKVERSDTATEDYPIRNPIEREYHENYSPETYMNAPVGLQLVGRRLQEEYLLQVLYKVVGALKE